VFIRQRSPSALKITSVCTVEDNKNDQRVIKVKTPGQINETKIYAEPLPVRIQSDTLGKNKLTIKRVVGSTTIRMFSTNPPKPTLQDPMEKPLMTYPPSYNPIQKFLTAPKLSQPDASASKFAQYSEDIESAQNEKSNLSVKDAYIKDLQESNDNLRNALLVAQKEATDLQDRAQNLSKLIHSMIQYIPKAKIINERVVNLSPKHQIINTKNSNPAAATPALPTPSNMVISSTVFLKTFPVSSEKRLLTLERNLHHEPYSKAVQDWLVSKFSRKIFLKPSALLRCLLNSIISPKLLANCAWKQDPRSAHHLPYVHLGECVWFIQLFENAANEISQSCFKKNMNKKAVLQFLDQSALKKYVDITPSTNPSKSATTNSFEGLVRSIKRGQNPWLQVRQKPIPKKAKTSDIQSNQTTEAVAQDGRKLESPQFEWVDEDTMERNEDMDENGYHYVENDEWKFCSVDEQLSD
jgi:hypothetical protein